jgi:hypothetical protein
MHYSIDKVHKTVLRVVMGRCLQDIQENKEGIDMAGSLRNLGLSHLGKACVDRKGCIAYNKIKNCVRCDQIFCPG